MTIVMNFSVLPMEVHLAIYRHLLPALFEKKEIHVRGTVDNYTEFFSGLWNIERATVFQLQFGVRDEERVCETEIYTALMATSRQIRREVLSVASTFVLVFNSPNVRVFMNKHYENSMGRPSTTRIELIKSTTVPWRYCRAVRFDVIGGELGHDMDMLIRSYTRIIQQIQGAIPRKLLRNLWMRSTSDEAHYAHDFRMFVAGKNVQTQRWEAVDTSLENMSAFDLRDMDPDEGETHWTSTTSSSQGRKVWSSFS